MKKPFFSKFLENQIDDSKVVGGGPANYNANANANANGNALNNANSNSALNGGIVTMKAPSDNDESGNTM